MGGSYCTRNFESYRTSAGLTRALCMVAIRRDRRVSAGGRWGEANYGRGPISTIRAVSSPELRKLRPSGSSASGGHPARVVREGAQDGAVVDVEELDGVVVRAGERVLVVGQRHGGHRVGVQLEGVLEGAVEEPHADGLVAPAAEEALAVGHRRHRAGCRRHSSTAQSACPAQLLRRLLLATLHTLMRCRTSRGWAARAADDVLAVGRRRHRVHRVVVPLEAGGVDERAVDVVHADLSEVGAAAKAGHKVRAAGQRRDAGHVAAHREGALERAVERPQLHGAIRDADEARSARHLQHRENSAPGGRLEGALARAVAPHLGIAARDGDDAAAGQCRHTIHTLVLVFAAAATKVLLDGRRSVAERAAGALRSLDLADGAEPRQHEAEDVGG